MIMKKLLRVFIVFSVCLLISLSGKSNPIPVYGGKISHLYFFEDGEFFLELYFMFLGDYDDIVIMSSSGLTIIDVSDLEVGDFLIIDSSEYPNLELDPTDGYFSFGDTFNFSDNGDSEFSIGTSGNDDVRPIPLGCGISNLTYNEPYSESKYVYDAQVNIMQSLPVTKGVVKATVYNLQNEILPGFIIRAYSNVLDESFCSSDDGYYYLNIYWDATMETTAMLSNLANTIESKAITGTPLDTTYVSYTYNVPSIINFSGTVVLEDQTNHEGSYVYLESYNPNDEILYHKIDNPDGLFALEISSGIYRVAYFQDHYSPNLTGNFLPYLGSKNVYKSLNTDEKVVNLISPDRVLDLVDSTYYLFSDICVPADISLDIYNNATVVLPLPKEIEVEGMVNIIGESNNPVSFISDYYQSPYCLFNVKEETGTVFSNYVHYEGFTTVYSLESSSLEVSNSHFIDNELIIYGNGSACAHMDNCTFEGDNPDSTLLVLRDNSFAEINNCVFENMKVFDVYDNAHIRFDSCSMLNCNPSIVWNYGSISINYSAIDNTTIELNRHSKSRINHSTFLNSDYALHYWIYGSNNGNYPDTSMLLQNSVFYNNYRHITGSHYGNGYLCYNQFYPYEEFIYFSNATDIGILTSVNINNDSCDIYHNIFMDPLLKDDLHLTWNSPCINAGDPNAPKDPDSTITDMGAYFYDLTALIDEVKRTNPVSVNSYPNPATEIVTFDISHQKGVSGTAIITLYNLNGVPVATNYQELPPSESITRCIMPLQNRGLATGVYVYTIEIPGQETVGGKLMVVK
jgi:hypothetical protein